MAKKGTKTDKPKKEPKVYGYSDSVEAIAKKLIPGNHSELASARIKYVCVNKGGKKGGKIVQGTAKKLAGAVQFMTDADFVIEVALDSWNDLNGNQRTALVDHLLECCWGEEDEETGDMKWSVRQPDVHEFSSILKRHGGWNNDLFQFVNIAKKVDLDGLVKKVEAAAKTASA